MTREGMAVSRSGCEVINFYHPYLLPASRLFERPLSVSSLPPEFTLFLFFSQAGNTRLGSRRMPHTGSQSITEKIVV